MSTEKYTLFASLLQSDRLFSASQLYRSISQRNWSTVDMVYMYTISGLDPHFSSKLLKIYLGILALIIEHFRISFIGFRILSYYIRVILKIEVFYNVAKIC